MVTNHICTVIRSDGGGNYTVVGRYPCMWQETEVYETVDYGQKRVSESRIYIPDITADVREGDYVTKKEIAEPVTDDDVSSMLSVVTIARNDYGSKSMQHIKAVAR